jgi:hypothetical protein
MTSRCTPTRHVIEHEKSENVLPFSETQRQHQHGKYDTKRRDIENEEGTEWKTVHARENRGYGGRAFGNWLERGLRDRREA